MKTQSSIKKKIAATVAVIALLCTALGATYAFEDYKQHKSNELNGSTTKYDARLIEDFAEVDDWTVDMGPITKKISVGNLGKADGSFGEVYVRIQLKEYMEIGKVTYVETSKRYMIDTDGNYIVFATQGQAEAATSAGGIYAGHNFAELKDAVTGVSGFFIETMDHDPNGQMGKHVVTDITIGAAEKVIVNGADRAKDTNHHGVVQKDANGNDVFVTKSDECDYTVHTWDGNELETREFIEWGLNTGSIIKLSDWDGLPVAKWIIDDESDSGWVYWGEALLPGEYTDLFMNSVTLVKQPEGSFYYVIHVELEAVSIDELFNKNADWGDVGSDFMKNRPSAVFDAEPFATVKIGETVASPTVTVGPAGAAQSPLTWSVSNGNATIDQDGKVTGVTAGVVTVFVKAPNGGKTYYTIKVVAADSVDPSDPGDPGDPGDTGDPSDPGDPGDTTLPVNKPDNGFVSAKDPSGDPELSDGYFAQIFYPDLSDPGLNNFYHNGSIHLEDIITDGNYSGVTVSPVDPHYNGYISIGADTLHGKPSIIYSYAPTEAEFKAWMSAGHSPTDDIMMPIQVTLTRDDGKSAIITINMCYYECQFTAF